MNRAALLFDDSIHHLDHLAPFCAQEGIPLIASDPTIVELAHKYYPHLTLLETDLWDLKLPPLVISCHTEAYLRASFPNQTLEACWWLPHGHSDKGWGIFYFEALKLEKRLLIYGKKMGDCLRQKGIAIELAPLGNFRYRYFQRHAPFYQHLLRTEFPSLLGRKNFLYAPTWDDAEKSCSLWSCLPPLIEALPPDCNLLVKPHPNTRKKYPLELELLEAKYEGRQNVLFLPEFPPIYPLLSLCSAYIGDMSSIGYDFLTFDRPLFFFNPNRRDRRTDPGLSLFQCGLEISSETLPLIFCDEGARFSPIRKRVYEETFSPG